MLLRVQGRAQNSRPENLRSPPYFFTVGPSFRPCPPLPLSSFSTLIAHHAHPRPQAPGHLDDEDDEDEVPNSPTRSRGNTTLSSIFTASTAEMRDEEEDDVWRKTANQPAGGETVFVSQANLEPSLQVFPLPLLLSLHRHLLLDRSWLSPFTIHSPGCPPRPSPLTPTHPQIINEMLREAGLPSPLPPSSSAKDTAFAANLVYLLLQVSLQPSNRPPPRINLLSRASTLHTVIRAPNFTH